MVPFTAAYCRLVADEAHRSGLVDYWIRGLLRRMRSGLLHGCTVAWLHGRVSVFDGSIFFGANWGEWKRTEAIDLGFVPEMAQVPGPRRF